MPVIAQTSGNRPTHIATPCEAPTESRPGATKIELTPELGALFANEIWEEGKAGEDCAKRQYIKRPQHDRR